MRTMLSAAVFAAAMGTCASARAELFTIGGGFTVNTTNSPLSGDNLIAFNPGITQSLDGGALKLVISVVDAGGGKEWAVFNYTTSVGQPLSAGAQNWSIEQVGIPTSVASSFIGDFTQWVGNAPGSINTTILNQTGSIFGQTLMSNPVPGGTGNGEGTLGFSDPQPAGPFPQLGAFANPFQLVLNGFASGTVVTGFTQALEFEPQTIGPPAVPEPSTWAMMLLGFASLGYAGFRRASKITLA